ncbi:hypothetical protein KO465_05590 [Candidatus Micrarchaeota archaeon]|nr:hypothetical protein [Candidatus Micrarchaeota archaeon]
MAVKPLVPQNGKTEGNITPEACGTCKGREINFGGKTMYVCKNAFTAIGPCGEYEEKPVQHISEFKTE